MKPQAAKTIWYAVGLALAIHGLFFVALWNHKNDDISLTNNNQDIHIQLVAISKENNKQENTIPKSTTHSKKKPPLVKEEIDISQQAQKHPVKQIEPVQQQNTAEAHQVSENKKNDFSLLQALLYDAINQKKHYPLSALRMRQQGKVRVTFRLYNNGNVDKLEVTQSSGYQSLDRAAIQAIERIQPFQPATEHLASAEDFRLDIIFQL